MRIIENSLTEVTITQERIMEQILSPSNLNRACRRVLSNRGSGGIDDMQTESLLPWLHSHKESLLSSLSSGSIR